VRALFENPFVLTILIVILVAVFAGPKLPGAAKGLAQSIRVFKKELNGDDKPEAKKTEKPKSEDEK
jgi:sec-independent protein translocase protein TatA